MPIPESTLSKWSHHQAGTAFKEAHVPIREPLDAYNWPSEVKFEVFLQGSYKNDTNLGGDSDVDVVIRLASKLKPRVVALFGEQLQEDGSHRFALERWQSFRDHAMKAMRARFGKAVKSGRKTIKVPKGKIPADADLVVTLRHRQGIGFYLPDDGRWVVSYPEQHHQRGTKEEGTGHEQSVQEDHPHVQGGPEPAGQQAGAHQRGRSLLLHRVSALQRPRPTLRREAGADL